MPVLNWLVANGLFRDLLSAGILVPIMHVMAAKPLRKIARIADRIDGRTSPIPPAGTSPVPPAGPYAGYGPDGLPGSLTRDELAECQHIAARKGI